MNVRVSLLALLLAGSAHAVPDGKHTLTAYACDAAGNCTESAPVVITVDNTPPTVAITSPASGANVRGKTTIRANTADATSACTHKLAIDGATVLSGPCGPISFNWNTRHLSKGAHTVVVTATDAAGNVTVKQIGVSV